MGETTLQGTDTYPTKREKENHRLKMPILGDMLVSWRVLFRHALPRLFAKNLVSL